MNQQQATFKRGLMTIIGNEKKCDDVISFILRELVLDEYGRWRDTEHFAAAGACANMVGKLMGMTHSRYNQPNQISESKTV